MTERDVRTDKVRVVAVDWSGAIDGARRKIWLAESDGVSITRLECGRNRDELIKYLITMSREDPCFVVGLDFAFSLPQWFLRDRSLGSALDLWTVAERESERWLKECSGPFWGRNRTKKTKVEAEFRRTELAVPSVTGIRPKSVFQVYGAGAVGTGSLRGLPFLKQLHDAGFSIWPFDPQGWPMVVEIYPRLLTGPINKSNQSSRREYLASRGNLSQETLGLAGSSEDAFDATVSAMIMAEEWDRLKILRPSHDSDLQLEGIIWHPGWEDVLTGLPVRNSTQSRR
jgi:hypothetical protein